MKNAPAGIVALLFATVSTVSLAQTAASDSPAAAREEIIVIGTAPLPGANIDKDKVPGSVETLSADDFASAHSVSILDALSRRTPGLSLSDTQGNAFFQDLHYHGFTVSPLQGTPQGIAVYQNGVRLNEAFGDTVNWDLAPEIAINRLTLASNNPAFGLNALGGAVNLEMKNGFNFQGLDAEILGGSFGRVQGSAEFGFKSGNFSLYVAGEGTKDDGWRYQSASDVERIYADAGYQGESSEFHLIASAARSSLGVVGPTPLELVHDNEKAIYTWPQTTKNETGMLALNGRIDIADGWSLEGNIYGRTLQQKHVDGNDSDFEGCSSRSSYGGDICLEDDAFGTPPGGKTTAFRDQFVIMGRNGQTFAFDDDTVYGTLDRTSTNTTSVGGSLQVTSDLPLFGHDNRFAFGASIDHSDIIFTSSSELGVINPDFSVGLNEDLDGSGAIIHTLGALGYQPVSLGATTDYYGIYASDTFDVTSRLAVTLGLRINIAEIGTTDRSGISPELNGSHSYDHANPLVGATYKIADDVTAYAGFSQSNRAPTPLELDCADPVKPCLLENSLVADPDLKQVVANTYEVGLRGAETYGPGHFEWTVGLYRTESEDDIIALASTIQGRGYYKNVPETLRQGFDLGASYRSGDWQIYANYSFIDATYQFDGLLASPNNPQADDDGNIAVHKGNKLPGIPRNQVKVGLDYAATPEWTVGGDLEAYGSQYLVGDDANQNAKLTPYWIMNIRTSYQVTQNIQVVGGINNLFDRRYGSYGTYFETDGAASDILGREFNDARSVTLGQPRSFFGGVKLTF